MVNLSYCCVGQRLDMDTDKSSSGLCLGFSLLGISNGPMFHYLVGGSLGCIQWKSYVSIGCTSVLVRHPTLTTNLCHPGAINYKLVTPSCCRLHKHIYRGGKHWHIHLNGVRRGLCLVFIEISLGSQYNPKIGFEIISPVKLCSC